MTSGCQAWKKLSEYFHGGCERQDNKPAMEQDNGTCWFVAWFCHDIVICVVSYREELMLDPWVIRG